MQKKTAQRIHVGWRETVCLPELGLEHFPAKIDTGARTTALHANELRSFWRDGRAWVEFIPDHTLLSEAQKCEVPVHHIRSVTNTSGIPEERFVIVARLRIGDEEHRVEISLTDRSDMKFPIIIGRTALRQMRLVVDPSRSWLVSTR